MVGTAAAVAILIAIFATIGLMLMGAHQMHLPKWSTGFIYWPAFIGIALPSLFITSLGASLAHKIPVNTLRKLFAAVVFAIGLQMLF